MIRKIFQWLLRNQKKEIEYKTEEKVKILMFSDYVPRIPEIILYIRRQRPDGRYEYRYKDEITGKRNSVYAADLASLREMEKKINKEFKKIECESK